MKRSQTILSGVLSGALISLNLISIISTPDRAIARPEPYSQIHGSSYLIAQEPGGTRVGRGGRGLCLSDQLPPLKTLPPLTALIPEGNAPEQTISEHPTFWFYVPYTQMNRFSARLIVQTDQEQEVLSVPVRLPKVPGVISVKIPATNAPLEVNKLYKWTFQVECTDPADQVSGKIQRVAMSATKIKQIEAAPPRQQAALYIENGIWSDALTVLGNKRRATPQDQTLTQEWMNLLNQIKLKNIATQAIAN